MLKGLKNAVKRLLERARGQFVRDAARDGYDGCRPAAPAPRKVPAGRAAYFQRRRRMDDAVLAQNREDFKHWPKVGVPRNGDHAAAHVGVGGITGRLFGPTQRKSKNYEHRIAGTRVNASNSGFCFVAPSKPGKLSGLGGKYDPNHVLEAESARREAQSERDIEACRQSRARNFPSELLPQRLPLGLRHPDRIAA
jgi:hypothetical protein